MRETCIFDITVSITVTQEYLWLRNENNMLRFVLKQCSVSICIIKIPVPTPYLLSQHLNRKMAWKFKGKYAVSEFSSKPRPGLDKNNICQDPELFCAIAHWCLCWATVYCIENIGIYRLRAVLMQQDVGNDSRLVYYIHIFTIHIIMSTEVNNTLHEEDAVFL